ncbi:MAG: hypothetical protein ACPIOQ_72035, partial [Promethearchaeia archaeon]
MRGVITFLGSSVPIEGASQHQPMSANEVQTGRRLSQRRRCLSADVVREDCAVWFAPRSLVPGAAKLYPAMEFADDEDMSVSCWAAGQ